MGLHLDYELALPPSLTMEDVVEHGRQPHAAAARLPFDEVGPLIRIQDGAPLGIRDGENN